MRDESPDRAAPRGRVAALAALLLLAAVARPATAQSVRGYSQLQFQRFDLVGTESDRELWLRTLQLDVTRRFGQDYDVTGQIYWNEVSTVGRPDRVRSPRGTLRLAHPMVGAWISYRPLRMTDPLGLTTVSNELQASAYLTRPHFPALNGTWTRRTQDTPTKQPNPATNTWNLTAAQALGPASLHAGWFDQLREAIAGSVPADERRNVMGGGEVRFGPPRASFLGQYDVNETKRFVSGTVTERTLLHSASLNGTSRFSRRTDASLSYAFRRTITRNGLENDRLDDHDGSALFNLRPRPAIRLSSGGGVRTVHMIEENDLQWYLLLLASVEGRIRPDWNGRAGVARSFNWTGRDRARPIDTYQANTIMRLARGLDLTANSQVSVTDASGRALADSIGRNSRVVSQGSIAVTATPLRRITAVWSLQGYRSGPGLWRPASTSRSGSLDLRWTPVATLDLNGSVQRTRGLRRGDPTVTSWRGTGQWTPSRNLELSGTYLRSQQPRGEAGADLPAGLETWSARALVGFSNDLRLQALWSIVDPGRTTRATRIELGATLALRR
ncbi:MAG: hypothetical protein ACM3PF_06960 [Bacteroidota bacterium]